VGRPIGSSNRERPFADALRVALRSGNPHRLRAIAEKLIQKALDGDLPAIRDLADRLDGKPAQAIERSDVMVEMLTDAELLLIAAGGLPEALSETSYPKICVANWGLIWGLDRLSCKISKNYQHLNSHCWRREWDSNPLSLC